MPLQLEIGSHDGARREVALGEGSTRVEVRPGDQFRLRGDAGEIPAGTRALRVGNALVIGGLPDEQELVLGNFFGACRPGSDCTVSFDAPGAPDAVVTNETAPLAALADGSFLLMGPIDGLEPIAATGTGDTAAPDVGSTVLVGLGLLLGLGAAAGAAGGGGGGGGAGPTAVLGAGANASPPTPAPTAAPAPAPALAPAPAPAPTPTPTPPPADTTPPSLTITDDAPDTARGTVTFTFRFSEPVTGFTVTDVAVAGGRAGALQASADAATYTLAVSPDTSVQSGQVTVEVAAGAATDAAGNTSLAAPRATQAYDTRAPVIAVTDDAGGTANRPVVFTFRVDEAASGLGAEDIAVSGGARGALVAGGDGRSWTMAVTPASGVASGQIVVDVAAGALTDAAGNANAAVRTTQPIDTVAPAGRVSSFVVTDDVRPDRGRVDPGDLTNDRAPTVALTLDSVLPTGETLTLARDGAAIRTLGAGGRTLSFNESTLAFGAHTYTASITDAAGNSTVLDLNGGLSGTTFAFVVTPI